MNGVAKRLTQIKAGGSGWAIVRSGRVRKE